MTFKVRATIWFWIAILASVVIAVAGILALMGKVDMDKHVSEFGDVVFLTVDISAKCTDDSSPEGVERRSMVPKEQG